MMKQPFRSTPPSASYAKRGRMSARGAAVVQPSAPVSRTAGCAGSAVSDAAPSLAKARRDVLTSGITTKNTSRLRWPICFIDLIVLLLLVSRTSSSPRSELFEPRYPGAEVWALAPDDLQTDQFGHLWSHDGLSVTVVGELTNDALPGSSLLAVVDQLRRDVGIGDSLKCCNFLLVVVVKISKPSRFGEEVCLVLV